MARINTVNTARKAQGSCYSCHEPIEPGQSYCWHKANRFAMRYAWHAGCPSPRPSALESNEKVATVMAAQENASDALDELTRWDPFDLTYAEIRDHVTETLEGIRDSAADEMREAVQLFEEQSMELRERGEQLDNNIEELDGTEVEDDPGEDASDTEVTQWIESAISAMQEAIDSVEIP